MFDDKIQIIKGNAVNVNADAIVNSANNNLMPGSGVNKMIFYSAGNGLFDACVQIGYCETGKAVITDGFNTPAKYIIHAVGPYWHGGYENEARDLASCYVEIMKLAEENGCKSIVIPAICTGDAGYPLKEATRIAITTVKSYIRMHNLDIKVCFVCSDNDTIAEYRAMKNKSADISKYILRKNIKIEAQLTKEEKGYAKTGIFSKSLSDKQKIRLVKMVFDRITKTDYQELIFLPPPYTRDSVNSELCERYDNKTGPYVTMDCISDLTVDKGIISFIVNPCAYRFEDEFQNIIETNDGDNKDALMSDDYDSDSSYEENFDIETALEMVAPEHSKKKVKSDYQAEEIFCDVEKLLLDIETSDKEPPEETVVEEFSIDIQEFVENEIDDNIEYINEYSKNNNEIVTDELGNGHIAKLPIGVYKNGVLVETIDYSIIETCCPDGIKKRKIPVSVLFDVPDDADVNVEQLLNLSNEYLYANVVFFNNDIRDKETHIKGSVFCLCDEDDNLIPVSQINDGEYNVDLSSKNTCLITDGNGRVQINGLKFGKYYISQIKAANGYVTDGDKKINFVVDNNMFDEEQNVVLTDIGIFENYHTTIMIHQIDSVTKNYLANIKFSLLDSSGNAICDWESAKECKVLTHLTVDETYTLIESNEPYAYAKLEPITFVVKNVNEYQDISVEHDMLYGGINITQKAEVLSSSKVVTEVCGYRLHTPEWGVRRLPDVCFELYATEDVVHPDGTSDAIYKAGDLVNTLSTRYDGIAHFDNLPFGDYTLKIKSVPIGYVLPTNTICFKVENDKTVKKIIFALKQRLNVKLSDIDSENRPVINGLYGLFAAKDIRNVDGKLSIPKDGLIYTGYTHNDGALLFNEFIPIGEYYIKELRPAPGYLLSDQKMKVDCSDSNKDVCDHVPNIDFDFNVNSTPIVISVSNIDQGDVDSLVPGVNMMLIKDGKVIRKWTTDSSPTILSAIPAAKYILHTDASPKGYAAAANKTIVVEKADGVQKFTVEVPRKMLTLKVNTTIKDSDIGIEEIKYKIQNNTIKDDTEYNKKTSIFRKIFKMK